MAYEIIMPKVDMVMETGTFVEWLKKEGEPVKQGEPLFVIMTDKSAIEVEAPADGILAGACRSQRRRNPGFPDHRIPAFGRRKTPGGRRSTARTPRRSRYLGSLKQPYP